MALRVRRIKKAFGFDKSKTEKYVIVPDRATVVGFEALCDQVAAVSGINLGNGSIRSLWIGEVHDDIHPARPFRASDGFRYLRPFL